MPNKKEKLEKLIDYINEIAKEPGNEWFGDKLQIKSSNTFNDSASSEIKEIYEYCIKLILKDHAEKFYSDFKLMDIKEKLVIDFIRMEKFRRDNNFEDFCLAAFQQFEAIVNRLCSKERLIKHLKLNKNTPAILKYEARSKTLIKEGSTTIGGLIFQTNDINKINDSIVNPPEKWFFNYRFRAVLYYYYFDTEVKISTDHFEKVYEIGNFLTQGRNMNHRGSVQRDYQQKILDDLIPKQHKYYFKFLGFLEDFISSINKNL